MADLAMLFALLAGALAIVAAGAMHRALAAVHTTRRAARELDRAEWRRRITRS